MTAPAGAKTVLFLTVNPQAPSFRYRLAPVMALLQASGWSCTLHTLPERAYGWRIWRLRHELRRSAVVVLHKLRLNPWELRGLQTLAPATLFDVDDAIWLRQPKQVGQVRPVSARRERNFAAMCALSRLTVAGNPVLAAKALAAGGRVEVVPTPVDAQAYTPLTDKPAGQTLVWVGLPGNLQYLEPLRPVLASLARRHPGLRLRVISSAWPDWDDVPVERVVWSAEGEKTAIASADIGIMPLSHDDYSRGKCAFKLLQYMAAGLPCVASPVGANQDVVQAGHTGYLADTPAAWTVALDSLLQDAALRRQLGAAGRQRVLAHYDQRVLCTRVVGLIGALAGVDAKPSDLSHDHHPVGGL